jgi:hypothetical protein
MLGKSLVILLSAVSFVALPGAARAEGQDDTPPEGINQDIDGQRSASGGDSYGDRNRGGPYGFYSYPRHRSIDGGRGLERALSVTSSGDASHGYDRNYGSAWYGRDYGAPYFAGAYYDRGTYYRERRD